MIRKTLVLATLAALSTFALDAAAQATCYRDNGTTYSCKVANKKPALAPVQAAPKQVAPTTLKPVATPPSKIVAQGGGNIVAQGGGNIVAQGGGNKANPKIISTNSAGMKAPAK